MLPVKRHTFVAIYTDNFVRRTGTTLVLEQSLVSFAGLNSWPSVTSQSALHDLQHAQPPLPSHLHFITDTVHKLKTKLFRQTLDHKQQTFY